MDFAQLYNVYYMKVYSYILTLSRNKDMAEEITQKAFYKAMSTEKKYREECSEYTWLCAIAKNLFNDEMRAKKHFEELNTEVASDVNVEYIVEDEDSMLRIHKILHTLEEPYKEVFQLRVFGELSFGKIGLILEKTETWARVTYHRARLKIQERMEIE